MKSGAIILSGGKSSRMGANKALLEMNEKTSIQRIYDELKRTTENIILVTNDPESYEFLNIRTVTDRFPGMGPLAGIHAGLIASPFDVNLVAACDMPFISAEAAEELIKSIGRFDAAVPVISGKRHPLFAVYRKDIAFRIQECLETNQLRMKHLLDGLNVRYVTEKDFRIDNSRLERIFFNMNHPNEYEEAKKWLGQQGEDY